MCTEKQQPACRGRGRKRKPTAFRVGYCSWFSAAIHSDGCLLYANDSMPLPATAQANGRLDRPRTNSDFSSLFTHKTMWLQWECPCKHNDHPFSQRAPCLGTRTSKVHATDSLPCTATHSPLGESARHPPSGGPCRGRHQPSKSVGFYLHQIPVQTLENFCASIGKQQEKACQQENRPQPASKHRQARPCVCT